MKRIPCLIRLGWARVQGRAEAGEGQPLTDGRTFGGRQHEQGPSSLRRLGIACHEDAGAQTALRMRIVMREDRTAQSRTLLSIQVEPGEYKTVPDEMKLGGTIMPLAGMVDGSLELLGTCFGIGAHGFLLTSKHVLEPAIGGPREVVNRLWALYEREDLAPSRPGWLVGGPLPVRKVCPHPESDLAVLQVALPRYRDGHLGFNPLRVDLSYPWRSQECLVLGFPRMRIEQLSDGSFEYERPLVASRGVVTDVYLDGRDMTMPFPCFATTAGADSGMSGGPILTGDGRLVAVMSRSFAPETRSSHGALLFPVVDIVVPMRRNGSEEEVTVRYLGRTGRVLLSSTDA